MIENNCTKRSFPASKPIPNVLLCGSNNIFGDRFKMNNDNKKVHLTLPVAETREEAVVPGASSKEWATLSMNQYCSANFFAQKSREIEEGYNKNAEKDLTDQQRYEHTAYVIGSIFAARGYLEAAINQVFLDAVESAPVDSITAPLTSDIVRDMATAWDSRVDFNKFKNVFLVNGKTKGKVEEWTPAENKYQCALVLAGEKPFDGKEEEFKSISVLRKVRNDLVHHTPGWITYNIGEDRYYSRSKKYKQANDLVDQLTKYVKKYGKDPNSIKNPLVPVGSSHFPHTYLGSTCAEWAVKSSEAFTDMFFLKKMGLNWSKLKDLRYKKLYKSRILF